VAEKEIHRYYHHIDNGGFTLRVYDTEPNAEACFPWVTFSEGFFGYATGSVTIHNQGVDFLRKLAENLDIAANKLETYCQEKEKSAPERMEGQRRKRETKQLFDLANKLGYQFLEKPGSNED
jgi:hypothetical protein